MYYRGSVVFTFKAIGAKDAPNEKARKEFADLLITLSHCPHYEWKHNDKALTWVTDTVILTTDGDTPVLEITLGTEGPIVETKAIGTFEDTMSDLAEAAGHFAPFETNTVVTNATPNIKGTVSSVVGGRIAHK